MTQNTKFSNNAVVQNNIYVTKCFQGGKDFIQIHQLNVCFGIMITKSSSKSIPESELTRILTIERAQYEEHPTIRVFRRREIFSNSLT